MALLALAVAIGCAGTGCRHHFLHSRDDTRSIDELHRSAGWYDLDAQLEIRGTASGDELIDWATKARAITRPAVPSAKKNVLVVSGGGIYGAYPAGVLTGWTETGTRPQFDVVTGVSTGALVGVFAFLGPAYDCELRRYYTTMRKEDIYRKRHVISALLSESFADSAPLVRPHRRVHHR